MSKTEWSAKSTEKVSQDTFNPGPIDRRTLLGALTISGCAAAVCGLIGSSAHAADGDEAQALKPGDRFALEVEEGAPRAVRLDDIAPGTAIMGVYPLDPVTGELRNGSRLNMVNLARLAEVKSNSLAAAASGVVAYSAVCTHKGCTINSWSADERHWRCFCHMSEFDAAANGEVVAGPAPESLPTVPVSIDEEGFITATAVFSSAPGAAA